MKKKAFALWAAVSLCLVPLAPAAAETRQAVIVLEGMEEAIEETLFRSPQGFSFWYPPDRLEVYNGSIGVMEGAIVTGLYSDDSMILSAITEEEAAEYAGDSGTDIVMQSASSRVQMDVYREEENGRIYFLTVIGENGQYVSAVGEYSLESSEGNAKFFQRVLDNVSLTGTVSEAGSPDSSGQDGFYDTAMLKQIPGRWTAEDEDAGYEAALALEDGGNMSLRFRAADGKTEYTYLGTWTFELIPDYGGRLELLFASTDAPSHAGNGYSAECTYTAYTESWVENDTQITYLILTPPEDGNAVSPFAEVLDYDDIALHREQGPNMRVVNCRSFVSLREQRSASSKRLAKVPLGALVLAFPEAGEQGGFIYCVYQGQEGFILSEYLQPVE